MERAYGGRQDAADRRRARFTRLFPLLALLGIAASAATPSAAGPAAAAPAALAVARAAATHSPAVQSPDPVEDESGTADQSDVDAQQALVAQLLETARRTDDALVAAQAQLRAASLQAGAALEAYASASRAALSATVAEDQARDELLHARLDAEQARHLLGEWARAAYRDSGTDPRSSAALLALLRGRPTDDVAASLQLARAVGDVQTMRVQRLVRVEQDQAEAVSRAQQASLAADTAAASADAARQARDSAVQARAGLVADLREQLTRSRGDVAAARTKADKLAEQLRRTQALANAGATTGSGGTGAVDPACPGGDLSGAANGQLPTDALCPLWQAPGQLLRADAAAAFNRLSRAYAETFATPICITDSYRTYSQQVTLYATKPALAAVPGTSNHGWGTATDLCGGIQRFGTPEHDWMVANAPAFGWFHPAWARPGGSRPEPWHFEYGG